MAARTIEKEVERMTNKQTAALLEAVEIITEKSSGTSEVIEAIHRIQKALKEKSAPGRDPEADKSKT